MDTGNIKLNIPFAKRQMGQVLWKVGFTILLLQPFIMIFVYRCLNGQQLNFKNTLLFVYS